MDKIEELKAKEPKANIFFRLSVIAYEFGDLNRDIVYMHRFPEEKNVHKAHMKLSLADLLTQLSLLCRELEFDEEELRKFGLAHLREKYAEFRKRGWIEIEELDANR